VESALAADIESLEIDYDYLFGWSDEGGFHLHHATPDQLIGGRWIDRFTWDSYYKFIIVRNPWDRAYSDYFWMMNDQVILGSFEDFIMKRGVFMQLGERTVKSYREDHLYSQSSYFTLAGQPVKFDRVLRFETLDKDLTEVAGDLGVSPKFFDKHLNVGRKWRPHYSRFYTKEQVELVRRVYHEDIQRFGYKFEDHKRRLDRIWMKWLLLHHPDRLRYLRCRFPRTFLFYRNITSVSRRLRQAFLKESSPLVKH
jgi:hypothetical protein